jgi:mannose-1-phosphate guanylyltransferase/mannose-6-phosphate isomerase
MTQSHIHPVILSGGSGTRLWPMSRGAYPKQLQPLCSSRPMVADTALRVSGPGYAPPLVVCNEQHRFSIAEALSDAGVAVGGIVLEPEGRNTAPAIAVAALAIAGTDPEGLLLVLPSDHVISDDAAFQAAVETARRAAAEGYLVTFGITPTHAETGYGYIQAGPPLERVAGAHAVATFKEKPDAETAASYLASGTYSWNSGMFLLPVGLVLDELAAMAPAVLAAARGALDQAVRDLDFCRLDRPSFAAAPSVSIDVAVMEHTRRAAVVPAEMGWSDVGAWTALWDIGAKDAAGNVCVGDILASNVERSYLRSENGPLVAVEGVSDLVVVATDDAVLVTSRERAQNVKVLVDALKRQQRPEHSLHSTVHRPWGTYRSIDHGNRFQVKRIMVSPGAQLSLQYHHHRAEHWIVVEGTARVTRGDDVFLLHENESTYIPAGETHRLENPGVVPLRLIEVQSGSYLGEDDIVRVEDTYGRCAAD